MATLIQDTVYEKSSLSSQVEAVGSGLARYGLAIAVAWIGLMKFTAYEAEGISPFVAHSPLAGGLLTGRYLGVESPAPGSRLFLRPGPYQHLRRRRVTAQISALREVASDLGMTMTALSLAWVMSTPGVTAVLIGPRRPEQFQDALTASERKLDEPERLAVVQAITHASEST